MFDPHGWSEDSYYEALAKAQKIEMDKLEKAKKERTKVSDGHTSWMKRAGFGAHRSCWLSPEGFRLLSPPPTPPRFIA